MGILSLSNFSLNFSLFRSYLTRRDMVYQHHQIRVDKFRTELHIYLEKNYSRGEYNVSKLSQDMALSRSQLFRKCKWLLGKSPIQLINEYRLDRARTHLKSGIYNVSEAAYMSGFNSLSYFTKSFKKQYGELPSKWVA